MPLKKGKGEKARERNIRELIAAGHDPRQAIAIAYRVQGERREKAQRRPREGGRRR